MPLLKQKLNQNQTYEIKGLIKNRESSKQEVCRAQAILLLNNGIDIETIEATTDYCRKHIFRLRADYLESGLSAILDKRKGKPKRLLTKRQIREAVKTVKEHSPMEFGYDSDFWTTGILGDFILRQHKVAYKSKTSYYLIFREAKFTFHKPGKIYHNHSDAEIAEWKEINEQKIAEALDDPDTVVLCEDEMHLSTQTTFQKIWLPEGEYPRVEISNKKDGRSIYGFMDIKSGKEHAFKTAWQNMYITAEILPKIRAIYPDKKILLIWDQAGWHKGQKAQEYITIDGKIKTLYFPRCAPELNPQEHVWKSGRDHCTHNKFIENIDAATDDFVDFLNSNNFSYSLLGFDDIS